MKIRCSNCSAAYAVDDAKVEGKKFGFECPKCGTSVVIDNRKTVSASVAAFAEQKTPSVKDTLPPAEDEMDFGAGLPDMESSSLTGEDSAAEETSFDESSFDLPSFDEPAESAEAETETASAEDGTDYDSF